MIKIVITCICLASLGGCAAQIAQVDNSQCEYYGFKRGTADFARCRMDLDRMRGENHREFMRQHHEFMRDRG